MRRYKAVSFDVGGTLLEPWPSVGHVYAAMAREQGRVSFDPAELNRQFAAAWRRMSQFDYSRRAWADLVGQTFGGSREDFGVTSPLFQALYARFSEPEVWHVYEDVRPTLGRLRELGFRLAVISNWDERLRPLLQRLDLAPFFEVIQVSCDAGCQKPNPAIFQATVRALQLEPEDVLHVGDHKTADYEGAQQAGLSAVLLRRGQALDGAHEIGSLAEIPRRVLRLPGGETACSPTKAK